MKRNLILGISIIIIVGIFLFIMMSRDSKAATYTINGEYFEIGGSYGITIPIAEISGLELKDSMPKIGEKTNGSGLGDQFKGEFTLFDNSKARLYVDASMPPFVFFMQGSTSFYINDASAEKTQELYAQLKAALQ